ncbi:MAG: DEAD/DEAH box helicase [Gemmatimonadota bacterium]
MKLQVNPREWQTTALSLWKRTNRGIIEVVTGAGKTTFALLCIHDFFHANPDGRVLILVPTLVLTDQWYVALLEDLGCAPADIAIYSGDGKPSTPHPINIVVLNTARDYAKKITEGAPTFLVVDECHRSATPMNAKALLGEHTATLGLSATPDRDYDEGLSTYLLPVLGPIIYRYTYEDAYRDGIITPFVLINVRVDLLPHEAKEFAKLTKQVTVAFRSYQKTGDDTGLKRFLQKRSSVAGSAAMRVPVAAALVEQHRGDRTIVFHEKIISAERIAEILRARGHSVTLYHSRIAGNVRRDNLRLFRRGVYDVLVSCRALDEGMNVPETSVAVIASSSASERQRIQRLGRVLRPARGKDKASIYTVYATPQERGRLLEEAESMSQFATIAWRQSHLRR